MRGAWMLAGAQLTSERIFRCELEQPAYVDWRDIPHRRQLRMLSAVLR